MRIRLERQGWKIAFANDICQDRLHMYAAHFEDADDHFVVEDIHKLSADDVPTVTLATSSFRCNDLSLAGGRAGLKGRQSSAFYGFIRVLREMRRRRPRFVLLENVTGFLTSHSVPTFDQPCSNSTGLDTLSIPSLSMRFILCLRADHAFLLLGNWCLKPKFLRLKKR